MTIDTTPGPPPIWTEDRPDQVRRCWMVPVPGSKLGVGFLSLTATKDGTDGGVITLALSQQQVPLAVRRSAADATGEP